MDQIEVTIITSKKQARRKNSSSFFIYLIFKYVNGIDISPVMTKDITVKVFRFTILCNSNMSKYDATTKIRKITIERITVLIIIWFPKKENPT